MASVILFSNQVDRVLLNRIASASGALGLDGLQIIGIAPSEAASYQSYPVTDSQYGAAMTQACRGAKSDRVLMIDARLASITTDEQLRDIMAQLANTPAGSLRFAAFETGSQTIDLAETDAAGVVRMLTMNSLWPTLAVAADRQLLADFTTSNAASSTEYLAQLMIFAIGLAQNIGRNESVLAVDAAAESFATLDNPALARCLNLAINSCNIEDLFPHHAWAQHGEESAAASYHTLAALFIRLNDTDSAMECLAFSDKLEDSPRSLALKGMIAMSRGETLGAVANIVSSLQQYEIRKDANGHYLHFQPQDLEGINRSLRDGLSALNKRDNEAALKHFADAVFSFDTFFSETGITGLQDRLN